MGRFAKMDKAFEKLIRVNTQGRVFVACQSRGVCDPTIIGYYAEILEQEILSLLSEASTPADFNRVLDERLIWLERELDQVRSEPPSPASDGKQAPRGPGRLKGKQATGHVPEAKTLPERLKDQRAIIEHLLDNDCITLKLVTPSEARQYKHGLLGKEPEKIEEELVASLRNVLYEQVRKFIRKHNGGPWASASQQHEVRMHITKTRTLRSLVALARELLRDREEWLGKSKGSLTGRFFGGRVKMNE